VEEFLNKHHITDKVLAVGVSGGADSLALVLQAQEELAVFGRKVIALTVNHGLRPSAAAEAEYVGEIMKEYGIEHHILEWQGEKPGAGIEEAARIARYTLLKQWCDEHDVRVLMVAHHLRDQAETFLMRLQRGSGLDGLCCMREVGSWNGLKILRPLLGVEPEQLQDYLKKKNVVWINDESNESDEFLRCRIRKFLPELKEKSGITVRRIGEAVMNLQSAESFINEYATDVRTREVRDYFGAVFSFRHTDYLRWHKEIKFRILAQLCRKIYIPRAESVLQLLAKLDRIPFAGATLGEKEIFAAYGKIWIVPELSAKHKSSRKEWQQFIETYPEYKNEKIPHKGKLAILRVIAQKKEKLNDL
jgi:tRNA(Ile)-lysidine synthase